MNWKKVLIPPVAIYAVIFLFISALVGAKVNQEGMWVWLVSLIISVVGLYLGTQYAKPHTRKEGLTYGVLWLVIFVALDMILTAPFAGWDYFSNWKSYIPYVLTVIMPTLFLTKKSDKEKTPTAQ